MGNTETTPEAVDPLSEEKKAPLDKRRIEADDLEYVKSVLTQANLQMECTPRVDGVGCQFTPLGWAIYHNSRQVTTYIMNLKTVDVTSPLVERMAPSLSFSKTLNSINGLDLAVILGNVEIVAEIMKLPLAWTRKFHDPLNWALFWAKNGATTEGIEQAPRKIQKSEEEAQKYEKIMELLRMEGAKDEATLDLDPIWEKEHTVKSIYPPKDIITVVRPVVRSPLANRNSPTLKKDDTQPSKQEEGETEEK